VVDEITVTHIGGPTVLLAIDGWRILTDPTFDAPGRRYDFGLGTFSIKTEAPAIAASALPPIDAVLLTHDHHADNLDDSGRALLDSVPSVVTTASGSERLSQPNVRGLTAWASTRLESDGKPPLTILATPCRHGPPLSRPVTGEVIGFAITRQHETHAAVWFSGDSVYYSGLKRIADRLDVDVAVIHLGAVRFRSTGPFRYTMGARQAVKLLNRLRPRVAVPVHTDGWSHFSEGSAAARRVFSSTGAPSTIRWLDPGVATPITTMRSSESPPAG
jgi:L-ascorbate metabolism protein UlaG (beta-lactamase superfamily)